MAWDAEDAIVWINRLSIGEVVPECTMIPSYKFD